jgi:putative heme-binding domain-containing protein
MQLIALVWALRALLMAGAVQAAVTGNRGDDPAAAAGAVLFRERCADCHGPDAKGARGPDLTQVWTAPGADERAFRTIRSGVPGSIMPPSPAPDTELRAIVAYLRSISTAKPEASHGIAANGERIFAMQCAGCHRINGRGGFLGPDLSRIAASQSNQLLTKAIRDASASFTSGYEPVTIVTRNGTRMRGVRKAEDAFSIQIMDTYGRLQGYVKDDLTDVVHEKQSLMPDFGQDRLTDQELDDLLAFLDTFRAGQRPRPSPPDPR